MGSRAVCAIAGLLLCHLAFADCIVRTPTPDERAYRQSARATLRKALPPAPANWTMQPVDDDPYEQLCRGDREGEFSLRVHAIYTFSRPREEKERRSAEARQIGKDIEHLRELPADVKRERQAWLDKMSEANRASNAAYKAGDKTLARQKDGEAEGYSAKARAIRDAYWQRVQPEVAKLEARRDAINQGDSRVEVFIVANEREKAAAPPNSGRVFSAGRVPAVNRGLKLQGARLMVTGAAPERGAIEAAVDQNKLNSVVQ